jgi:hypothetical protein
MSTPVTHTAFAGTRRLVRGDLETTLRATKVYLDQSGGERVLVFEDATGRQVDFDFSGTPDEVVARALPPPPRPGPGRPRLGVVSREVSLLPRHWEWLEAQPQGASAALRRLVDAARKQEPERERARLLRDAASRVMWVMAGDLPGFEEASRALFADEPDRFRALVRDWPADIREHLEAMVEEVERLLSPGA